MEAKDVRMENYVKFNDKIHKITAIDTNGFCRIATLKNLDFVKPLQIETHLKPIQLTKEILLKFGFEQSNTDFFMFSKDKLTIKISNPLDSFDKDGRIYWNYWTITEKQPQHAHELQNLYFALTKEELTFND